MAVPGRYRFCGSAGPGTSGVRTPRDPAPQVSPVCGASAALSAGQEEGKLAELLQHWTTRFFWLRPSKEDIGIVKHLRTQEPDTQ